mmetsp:Transcript_4189/g.5576  ORF Transcript_4189/g.5576 Transcript_4189/m.5576 type:complete len:117 (+) Transcript_4189:86-436(+)
MFCGVMEELESLCGGQFGCFIVNGYTKTEEEGGRVDYNAKIRVREEGDTPYIHVNVVVPVPNPELQRGPEVQKLKQNQPEDAPFNFDENDIIFRMCGFGIEQPEEVPAEEEQKPQG